MMRFIIGFKNVLNIEHDGWFVKDFENELLARLYIKDYNSRISRSYDYWFAGRERLWHVTERIS